MNEKVKVIIKNNFFLHTLARRIERINWKRIDGKGNRIIKKGALLKVNIEIKGNNNYIEFEAASFVANTKIRIRGNNHRLIIKSDCNFLGGEILMNDNDCMISIGKYTTIESADLAATENNSRIEIGEDCMFASSIEIRTSDAHSIIDQQTGARINPAKNVFIGNHVWLANDVKVLKGSSIQSNCVIGAMSIVNSEIPSNCLAVGIPAVVKKENIFWTRERV
jgi:acetyltransferase-like isoleucine patch superfamily enzyme